jgi:TatD DNase family protein
MFVDSHCHLDGPKYDSDRAEVLRRAAAAGVETLLVIGNGTGPGTYDCGIRVGAEFDSGGSVAGSSPVLYASVGIHPHDAKVADDAAFAELARLARHPRVIAWGEIGLDYWYDFSPREVQRSVFVRQMELARAARKPVVNHCRSSRHNSEDAWDDTIRLLQLNWSGTGLGGILHCFSGGSKHLEAALAMGFMISFAGNVTFPKAGEIREAARQTPLDRMLVETDSPYLAPVPYRGRRNEPAYVKEVAHSVANLRQMLTEELGASTTRNFYRFFRLDHRPSARSEH